jgi:hypothetical protein
MVSISTGAERLHRATPWRLAGGRRAQAASASEPSPGTRSTAAQAPACRRRRGGAGRGCEVQLPDSSHSRGRTRRAEAYRRCVGHQGFATHSKFPGEAGDSSQNQTPAANTNRGSAAATASLRAAARPQPRAKKRGAADQLLWLLTTTATMGVLFAGGTGSAVQAPHRLFPPSLA